MKPARFGLAVVVFLAAAFAASAQDVGSIAALQKLAEIGRSGTWRAAALGDGVAVGDSMRTDAQGRVRLVFADSSVVLLSGGSEIVIDENVYRPADGSVTSMFEVLKGKMRAIVSEYYQTSGTFEIKTANSVSGVRGTDFIVVHGADANGAPVSEVVGISGRVMVRGVAHPDAPVAIESRQWTQIAVGKPPSAPVTLSEERFRYYLEGLEFVGGEGPESLILNQPTLLDNTVPEPDRAAAERPSEQRLDLDVVPSEPGELEPDGSGVAGQPAEAVEAGDLGIRF